MRAAVELALDADGRILALRGRLLADLGAYLLPSTPIPPHTTAMLLAGCYDIQDVEVFVTGARTNKVPTAPYRGAGRPEASYLIETAIDAAARELGIDPVELRRRNLVRAFPYRTALGWTYDSGDFERCLDRALELLGEAPPPTRRAARRAPASRCASSARPASTSTPRSRADGEVLVRVGSMPSGQGHETLFAQIAADRLGVDAGAGHGRTGDTDALADGVGSFASRSTAMGGSAVAAAGRSARRRDRGRALCVRAGLRLRRLRGGRRGRPRDRAVRVRRLVAVDDAGRIINPLLAEGQVIGGRCRGSARA